MSLPAAAICNTIEGITDMFTLRRPPHQDEGMLIMSLCKLLHCNSMGPRGIDYLTQCTGSDIWSNYPLNLIYIIISQIIYTAKKFVLFSHQFGRNCVPYSPPNLK